MVVGREAGASKLGKIEKLKLKTLDEDGLFELILSRSKNMPATETLPKASSLPSTAQAPIAKAPTASKQLPARSQTIPAPGQKQSSDNMPSLG